MVMEGGRYGCCSIFWFTAQLKLVLYIHKQCGILNTVLLTLQEVKCESGGA